VWRDTEQRHLSVSLSHGRFCPPLSPTVISHGTSWPAPYHGGSASIPEQSMWDSWRIKWHRYRFLSQYFGYPMSVSHTNAPYLSSYWYYFYQKDKRAKGGNLQTKQSSFGYRDSIGQNAALILLWGFGSLNGGMRGISDVQLTSEVAYLSRQHLKTRVTQDRSESGAQRYTTAASWAIEIPLPSRADNCLFSCRCVQTLVYEPSVTWQVNFTYRPR